MEKGAVEKVGKMPPWVARLAVVMALLVYVLGCAVIIFWATNTGVSNAGVQLVKAMYEFRTPEEMIDNQLIVQRMLVEDEWKRLTIDEPLRNVNAYRKFNYSASKVHILEAVDGFVTYQILNDYINADKLWVLEYSVDKSGKLYDIKEYQAVTATNGGFYLQ